MKKSQSQPPAVVIHPQKIEIDLHFPASFFAVIWNISESTVSKWFRDDPEVLKLAERSKNGKRTRNELRIPYSVAMKVYRQRTRGE